MQLPAQALGALLVLLLGHAGQRGLASTPELRQPPQKIAVVGGGIGGAAAAYYLRQEFGAGVKIDVFEPGTVGGRLATVRIAGHRYEAGGTVIHPLNLHMKHFVERLGLSPKTDVPSKMAIYDGRGLTFQESDWFVVNLFRLLWRYGFDYLRMQMWVEGILDKFMRIYQYQQHGYAFTSVDKLIHAMGGDGFLTLMNQTLEDAMTKEGFSQTFVDEIVAPITRVNYGQSVRVHGFVGAVSVAGAGAGLWSVDGGNDKVCAGLLYHSKSELVPARVTSISFTRRPSKKGATHGFYEVRYADDAGSAHSLYDVVVIATPLHEGKSDIAFPGFSPPIPSHFPGRYHQTVATLVHGVLNATYLGAAGPASDFTASDILTTDSKGSFVNSLSAVDPAHLSEGYERPPAGHAKVWKVFSPQPLSPEQLGSIFASRDATAETRWLAYPAYRLPYRKSPPFVLHERMYYLNAVEWAASAMEMSAISARNAALLAHRRWHGQAGKVDREDLHARLRGEL